ncbi:MAG TPA: hypothetical protein VFE47_24215, partial [Tepidisphaeraceae bacterium]|nr:hypothetical protein [Tepidisphaeraceae bacterium]
QRPSLANKCKGVTQTSGHFSNLGAWGETVRVQPWREYDNRFSGQNPGTAGFSDAMGPSEHKYAAHPLPLSPVYKVRLQKTKPQKYVARKKTSQ